MARVGVFLTAITQASRGPASSPLATSQTFTGNKNRLAVRHLLPLPLPNATPASKVIKQGLMTLLGNI